VRDERKREKEKEGLKGEMEERERKAGFDFQLWKEGRRRYSLLIVLPAKQVFIPLFNYWTIHP